MNFQVFNIDQATIKLHIHRHAFVWILAVERSIKAISILMQSLSASISLLAILGRKMHTKEITR